MSDPCQGRDGQKADTSLPDRPSENDSALSDISPRDKPWDKHRYHADKVEAHYKGSEFSRYAERVSTCSQLLQFGLVPNADDTLKLKLRAARFCRVRHCPVCQWRRSLMWKAKAYKVLPKIVEAYPKHRWIFLTLTMRNCEIVALRETIQSMNKGFQRLSQRKAWPAVGWLKSLEVTRNKNNGTAHPHFHCLLMVKPGYFGKNYIKQAEWVKLWREAMRLDYDPILDCRAVKRGKQPMSLIPELLKYCTKESDLVAEREWFLELTRQMHKTKCITTGGLLKDYLRELESEPEDLIGKDGEADDDWAKLLFAWWKQKKQYHLKA